MRILITGGSGLLALNWALQERDHSEIILGLNNRFIELKGTKSIKLDLTSFEKVNQTINLLKPDLIINTAGITSVELCEKSPNLAFEVNTQLAINLARACSNYMIRYIHVSTDHLFAGDQEFTSEDQPICPKNIYGISKASAETGIMNSYSNALIIRTNFFGWGTTYRKSFSDTILHALRNNQAINLFEDVYYTPILTEILISSIHKLENAGAYGIYNITGDSRISKYHFGLKLAEIFNLDIRLINPTLMKEKSFLVQRPNDMSLSNKKVCDFLGIKMGSIDQHINRLQQLEVNGFNKEILGL